jgi:hypothetical protein
VMVGVLSNSPYLIFARQHLQDLMREERGK